MPTVFFNVRVISVSEGIQTRDLKFQTDWINITSHQTSISPSFTSYPMGLDPGSGIPRPFGNYTLFAGTHLLVNNTSGMDAVFTPFWQEELEEGTPVRIRFIHIPSGAVIAEKQIIVEV